MTKTLLPERRSCSRAAHPEKYQGSEIIALSASADRQTVSNRTTSASIALSDASKNVAENVPRLILFAMLASVSFSPCFSSRSASSRYPTSARASSAFRKRFAFSVTHLINFEQAQHRYSPAAVIAVAREAVRGVPAEISTSYVERSNLSLRMASRRFTRLTNAFSKKLDNHCAAVSLYVAHYNLCRVHESLRTSPACNLGSQTACGRLAT